MSEVIRGQSDIRSGIDLISKDEYLLSPEEMDEVEARLFTELKPHVDPDEDIVSVVVPWDNKFAKFGRSSETLAYGDFDNHAEMRRHEHNSFFIYTIDTESGRVAHVKRILYAKDPEEREATGFTGIEVIDDRLNASSSEESAQLDELMDFHDIDQIEQCWNVTSNHRTKRVSADFFERPYVLVSYKTVFELGRQAGVTRLFAYLNNKAINSLAGDAMQINYQLVGGSEYHLPIPEQPGVYDEDFVATCIPYSPENISKFTEVDESAIGTALIANRQTPIYAVQDTRSSTQVTRL